jgi:hypothetical protein
VAAIHYNPAALGATDGLDAMVDLQLSQIDINVTATRNDGTDPNTGEAYKDAEAHVLVPVFLAGLTWKPIKYVAVGFAATDSYVGGGDYSSGESDPPPYTGNQRYAGVNTQILTIALMPAVAITPIEGFHVGGGVDYVLDDVKLLKASDPLGGEGYDFVNDEPYATDVVLEAEGKGSHIAWNAGIFVDKFKLLQVGASYSPRRISWHRATVRWRSLENSPSRCRSRRSSAWARQARSTTGSASPPRSSITCGRNAAVRKRAMRRSPSFRRTATRSARPTVCSSMLRRKPTRRAVCGTRW